MDNKLCDFIITIKNIDGTSDEIVLKIDPTTEDYSSPEALIKLLAKGDKSNLKLFQEKVNVTHFPLTSLSEDEISGDMVCNYSLNTAGNIFIDKDKPELKALFEKVKELPEYNKDDYNIIITNNPSGVAGVYHSKENNRFITIMPNNEFAFKSYLEFLLVKHEAETNEDSPLIQAFMLYMLDVKETIAKTTTVKEEYPRLYKSIMESNLLEFLNVFYHDYKSFKYITKLQKAFEKLREVLKVSFNPTNLKLENYQRASKFLGTFMEKAGVSRQLTLKEIDEIVDLHLGGAKELKDPIAFTLYVNKELLNHGFTDAFFDIKFIGSDKVLYKKVDYTPTFTTPYINSHYYGEIVQPLYDKNGYHIYKVGDTIYASNIIPCIEEEGTLGEPFVLYEDARKYIDTKATYTRFTDDNIEYKVSMNSTEVIPNFETKKKLPSKFRFIALKGAGKKAAKILTGNLVLLNSISLESALKEMTKYATNALRAEAIKALIEYVGISSLKFQTFLKIWQGFINNRLVKGDPLINAVNYMIGNVQELLYEAESIVVNEASKVKTYRITEVKTSNKIPLWILRPRMLRLDIDIIAKKLKSRFGVNIETMTTSEIIKKFPSINPSANAFIMDKVIYVNVDRASSGNLIHEFGHLIFGTIKLTNFNLYDKFILAIDGLRETLPQLFKYYATSTRSRYDVDEEILADIFGRLVMHRIKEGILLNTQDMDAMKKAYALAVEGIFGTKTKNVPLTLLLQMTVDELKLEYGATELKIELPTDVSENLIFSVSLAFTSRKIANLIAKLKRDGILEESNC